MIFISLVVLSSFIFFYITARTEPPSYDSGTNLLVSYFMVLILAILTSFVSLQVTVDEKSIKLKFGYGLFRKQFLIKDIKSVNVVRNNWYYGWGIRFWLWPRMWVYNVSGFDAVEIELKKGKIYRIGTDEPKKLEKAIVNHLKL